MNINDIAKKAKVSVATVSRVINKSDKVKAETREKILNIMKEYDYTPNIYARALGLNTIKTIGLLCINLSDLYYATAVNLLEKNLRIAGYDVLIYCTGFEKFHKEECIYKLYEKRVDAVITIGVDFIYNIDKAQIENIAKKCPTILINSYEAIDSAYNIYCDEKNAIYLATKKLFDSKCKNIAFLYDKETAGSDSKKNGFIEAIEDFGISKNCILKKCEYDVLKCKEEVSKLLISNKNIDAIITTEDILAVGALKAIYDLDKISKISVVGFNNSMIAKCSTPTLTSIDNLIEAVTSTALNTLTNIFNNVEMPQTTVLSAKIVERESFKFKL